MIWPFRRPQPAKVREIEITWDDLREMRKSPEARAIKDLTVQIVSLKAELRETHRDHREFRRFAARRAHEAFRELREENRRLARDLGAAPRRERESGVGRME